MQDPAPSIAAGAAGAACAEDEGRLRDLGAQLAREKEAHERMDAACQESRKLIHALNNALSIVATFAATLADDVEDDPGLRETVEEIIRASRNAGVLSRRLGDVQRRAQGLEPPEPDQGRA